MNIAICDDEKVQREYLHSLVDEWSKASGIPVNYYLFQSAEAFLFAYEEEKDFDLLLLDIQMDGEDGITLAKKLRANDDNLSIVFVTGIDDYIGEGYEVSALHYLIKPIKKEKLYACLDKVAQIKNQSEPVLLVQTEREIRKVLHKDIVMIEAFAHNCVISTVKESFGTNKNLGALEKELASAQFVRCHRSVLINLAHIEAIGKTEVRLDGGYTSVVSRRLYSELNQAFIQYNKITMDV